MVPYPLDGGVWIRTYHVLRRLAQVVDAKALRFERTGVSGRRDEPKDFALAIDALARDPALRQRPGDGAPRKAVELSSGQFIGRSMNDVHLERVGDG